MEDPQQVWRDVLSQFEGAYGGQPDFTDDTDKFLFLGLLETAVRKGIEDRLVVKFTESVLRIRQQKESAATA